MLFLGISMAITWGISHFLRTKPFISIYIFIHTPILGSMQYEFTDIHRTNHQDLFKQSPDAGWPWLENRFLVGDWGNYGECQFTWMCNSRECAIHIIQLDMQPNNPNKCKGCIDWDRGQCIFMDNQTTADSILIAVQQFSALACHQNPGHTAAYFSFGLGFCFKCLNKLHLDSTSIPGLCPEHLRTSHHM